MNSKDVRFDVETENEKLNILPPKNLTSLFSDLNNFQENNNTDEISVNCNYYDVDTFSKQKWKLRYFSILHINIASLAKHKEELETLLKMLGFSFDILAITETKIIKGSNTIYIYM